MFQVLSGLLVSLICVKLRSYFLCSKYWEHFRGSFVKFRLTPILFSDCIAVKVDYKKKRGHNVFQVGEWDYDR